MWQAIVSGIYSAHKLRLRQKQTILDLLTKFLGYVIVILLALNVVRMSGSDVESNDYVSFGSLLESLGEFELTFDQNSPFVKLGIIFDLLQDRQDLPVIGELLYAIGSIGSTLIDLFYTVLQGFAYILDIIHWFFTNLLPGIFA